MSGRRHAPLPGADARLRATAVFLRKLARHLALIGCLMILAAAGARETIGQLTIFCTIVIAALLHGLGCYLQQWGVRIGRQPRYER
jgi:hypothetical protein